MPREVLLHLNGTIPDSDGRSAGDLGLDLERAVRSGAVPGDSVINFDCVAAEVIDGQVPEDELRHYTVIGVYEDNGYQRYASYFQAEDPDHAEEQARNEGGDSLVIAGVVRGRIAMEDT